jgi:hypothetical protein
VFQINGIIQEVTTQLDTMADTMASRFEVIEEITTENIAEMTSKVDKEISGVHTAMEEIKKN